MIKSNILKVNNKRNVIRVVLVLFSVFFVGFLTYIVYFKYLEKNRNNNQNSINETVQNETQNSQKLVCDRTTRLENDPQYDRALSLIYERLTEYGEDDRLFSPQLVNCIKVEVENIKKDTNAEGYFDGSNEDIKSNYFPIVIDSYGGFVNDDLSNALLLVHEITHVSQYISNYNLSVQEKDSPSILSTLLNKTKSSCLDDEVKAFKTQLIFTTKLKEEELNSIYSRIKLNNDLNSQLAILKTLEDSFKDFNHGCKEYNVSCIDNAINYHIYSFLRDSGVYDEQCGAYPGTYIGE